MSRMRVLLIIESMGGSSRHVADLIRGLDPSLFDIELIYGTSRIDDYFAQALPELAKLATLRPCDDLVREIEPKRELRALRFVIREIRAFRPNIVHCHSSKAGVIGRVAAKLCHVNKVFYTPHAYSFLAPEFSGKKRDVFIMIERMLSRHATTLTFNVSDGERKAAIAERLDKPSKFRTLYNGLADVRLPDRREARARLGLDLPDDAKLVGSTARLVEQKDPMTSVAIAAKLIERHPELHVAYIGDGPYLESMKDVARQHDVLEDIHFLGYRADADRMVAAFDVYLLTSLYEGLPYSLVESLRAGVPVAATDVTGNNEVVDRPSSGRLFPSKDVEAGVAAVEDLLAHPIPREQARQGYLDRFTMDAMLGAITEVYRQ